MVLKAINKPIPGKHGYVKQIRNTGNNADSGGWDAGVYTFFHGTGYASDVYGSHDGYTSDADSSGFSGGDGGGDGGD